MPGKAFVLLVALLMDYPGGVARSELATLLWSEAETEKAFANLRQLLASIRSFELKSSARLVRMQGRSIFADAQTISSDLAALLTGSLRPETLAVLAKKSLLSGVEVAEPDLTRWIEDRRETVQGRIADALIAAVSQMPHQQLEDGFAAMVGNRLDERVARARMTNLAGLGDAPAARAVYHQLTQDLRAELGVAPEPDTQALAARIAGRASALVSILGTPEPVIDLPSSRLPKLIIFPPDASATSNLVDHTIAAGFVQDVNLQLCRTRRFAVFAPHTARLLTGADPLSAAAPYDIDYLVTTSLFPGQRAPRLAFSMISTRTRQILIADEIEVRPETLLANQATLANVVAATISDSIGTAELAQYRSTGAASAYVQFLLGANLLDGNDLAKLRRARRHLSQALKLSKDYVPALSATARTLSLEWLLLGRTDRTLLAEAQKLAQRAVALDPMNAAGHRELGHAAMYLGDLDESESHFETALERAPHYADILADRADILVHNSRIAEAKARIDEAIDLNPLAPDDYLWISGSVEFFIGDYSLAVERLQAMKDQSMVGRLMAAAAAMAGDLPLAHRQRDLWLSRYPDFQLKDFPTFMPHRSSDDVDRFVSALAMAGFR